MDVALDMSLVACTSFVYLDKIMYPELSFHIILKVLLLFLSDYLVG